MKLLYVCCSGWERSIWGVGERRKGNEEVLPFLSELKIRIDSLPLKHTRLLLRVLRSLELTGCSLFVPQVTSGTIGPTRSTMYVLPFLSSLLSLHLLQSSLVTSSPILPFPSATRPRPSPLSHSITDIPSPSLSRRKQWYNSKEGHHQTHLEEVAAEHAAAAAKAAKAAK